MCPVWLEPDNNWEFQTLRKYSQISKLLQTVINLGILTQNWLLKNLVSPQTEHFRLNLSHLHWIYPQDIILRQDLVYSSEPLVGRVGVPVSCYCYCFLHWLLVLYWQVDRYIGDVTCRQSGGGCRCDGARRPEGDTGVIIRRPEGFLKEVSIEIKCHSSSSGYGCLKINFMCKLLSLNLKVLVKDTT